MLAQLNARDLHQMHAGKQRRLHASDVCTGEA